MLKVESNKTIASTLYLCSTLIRLKVDKKLALPWESRVSANQTPAIPKHIIKKVGGTFYRKCRTWSLDEIKALDEAHQKHGPKWLLISQKYFPSRTPKSIEQKWYRFKADKKYLID
ncbi:hypothetical protein G9A89_023471 [Geosiphon pyriformis]|nr:hypothetical protein G9A89_023471 [Geosiphon pyriformis]